MRSKCKRDLLRVFIGWIWTFEAQLYSSTSSGVHLHIIVTECQFAHDIAHAGMKQTMLRQSDLARSFVQRRSFGRATN